MATPGSTPTNPAHKGLVAAIFSHPSNDAINRINKILASTAGVDSTLLLVGYSMTFVSGQLTKLLEQGSKGGSVERITNIRDGAKVLSGSCSDVRAFMRLWGLLKMWALARATYFDPPKDGLIRTVTWGKILGISGYYALEHGFYLGTKGFYKGWKPEDIGKWFRTAILAYGFYLGCDYIALWRQAQLQQLSEKSDPARKAVEDRQWWKTLQVNAAYSPLVFHWATAGGLFSDSVVGFLGACAGLASVREAWIQAA